MPLPAQMRESLSQTFPLESKRTRNIALGLVLALAAVVRLWGIDNFDEPVFDEIHYIPAARVLVGLDDHPGLEAWRNTSPLIAKSPDINFSHPVLGKLILGWSMHLLGNNPLGWRLAPFLFGMLSLWLFFLVAQLVLKSDWLAVLATLLLSLDLMHLVQSRIAMLDSFLLAFGMLNIYSVLRLSASHRSVIWMFCYALSAALVMSTKHVGAVMIVTAFVIYLWLQRQRLRWAIGQMIFLNIAALILYSGWALYFGAYGFSYAEWWQYQWDVAVRVLAPLKKHGYSSTPIEWLLNIKPVLYAFHREPSGLQMLASLVHPVTSYTFLLAFSYWSYQAVRRRISESEWIPLIWFLLCFGMIALLLIQRTDGFLYHLFPAVPAMVLVVTMTLDRVIKNRDYYLDFLGIVIIVFGFYAPVVIGFPIGSRWYSWLKGLLDL